VASKQLMIALSLGIGLAACNATPPREPIRTQVDLPMPIIPSPAPLNFRDVKWQVYNKADIEILMADLKDKEEDGFAIFALDAEGYEALALNVNELRRYVLEQQQVILFLTNVLRERSSNVGIVIR
jgi:HAMP domain-containing protein